MGQISVPRGEPRSAAEARCQRDARNFGAKSRQLISQKIIRGVLHQFTKHYTREEARALLPRVRACLQRMARLRLDLQESEKHLEKLRGDGADLGGAAVNQSVSTVGELHQLLLEFQERQIQIKDLERGLIDFPAILGGREVFLCWEQNEADIDHWHELNAGYAGRQKL